MNRLNTTGICQSCGDQNAASNQPLAPAPLTVPGKYGFPLPYVIAGKTRGPLYGYPAELIAEWCSVARSTAYAWKTGSLKPSKPAAKLFRLHRDRMVLTPEWRGWFVTRNAIVDPDGNETPRGLLHNYHLMMQYCRELAVRTGDEQEIARWRRLLEAA